MNYGRDLILHFVDGSQHRYTGRQWNYVMTDVAVVFTDVTEDYTLGYPWHKINHYEVVPGKPPRQTVDPFDNQCLPCGSKV